MGTPLSGSVQEPFCLEGFIWACKGTIFFRGAFFESHLPSATMAHSPSSLGEYPHSKNVYLLEGSETGHLRTNSSRRSEVCFLNIPLVFISCFFSMFLSVPREHSFLAFLVLTIFGQHKGAVSLVEELAKFPRSFTMS